MPRHVIRVIGLSCSISLGVLSVLLAARPAAADWSLQSGGAEGCWLESPIKEMETGYNQARVKILVEKARVVIESDAKLDDAFGDLGLTVDRKARIGVDRIEGERKAVVASDYDTLIGQFKAGLRVALQLRFWPTWPTTGTHGADFSLVGFSKAYAGLEAC